MLTIDVLTLYGWINGGPLVIVTGSVY